MEILSPHHGSRCEAGVTLVETLVALLILSFVAVSTLAMFSQGMALNTTGQDYNAITNIAKDKSEQLVGKPFTHTELVPDITHSEPHYISPNRPPVNIQWFVAEHNIVQAAPTPGDAWGTDPMISSAAAGAGNVKVIRVTVTSQGVFGLGQRTVSILSIRDNT